MGVPAHDERDFEFATLFKLPIVEVISPDGKPKDNLKEAYVEPGVLVNSGQFNNLPNDEGKQAIISFAEQQKMGNRQDTVPVARLVDQSSALLGLSYTPDTL